MLSEDPSADLAEARERIEEELDEVDIQCFEMLRSLDLPLPDSKAARDFMILEEKKAGLGRMEEGAKGGEKGALKVEEGDEVVVHELMNQNLEAPPSTNDGSNDTPEPSEELEDGELEEGELVEEEEEPNDHSSDGSALFIPRLDSKVSDSQLFDHFVNFDGLESARTMRVAPDVKRGYLVFQCPADASLALKQSTGTFLSLRPMFPKYNTTPLLKDGRPANRRTLIVKNIDPDSTVDSMTGLFSEFGQVQGFKFLSSLQQPHPSTGFLKFSNPTEAHQAVVALNGKLVGSSNIFVGLADGEWYMQGHPYLKPTPAISETSKGKKEGRTDGVENLLASGLPQDTATATSAPIPPRKLDDDSQSLRGRHRSSPSDEQPHVRRRSISPRYRSRSPSPNRRREQDRRHVEDRPSFASPPSPSSRRLQSRSTSHSTRDRHGISSTPSSSSQDPSRDLYTLFIPHLDPLFTERDLLRHFSPYGPIESARVRTLSRDSFLGFVTFRYTRDARAALLASNGQLLGSRRSDVTYSKLGVNSRVPSASTNTIYLSDLDPSYDVEELARIFSRFGTLVGAKTSWPKDSRGSFMIGFVQFEGKDDATRARLEMDGKRMGFQRVRISTSKFDLSPPESSRVEHVRRRSDAGRDEEIQRRR